MGSNHRTALKSHAEAVIELAKAKRYFNSKDVEARRIPRVVLTRLVREGYIERLSRGIYQLSGQPITHETKFVIVSHHYRQGVMCLATAFEIHRVLPSDPLNIWLALPPGAKPSKFHIPGLRIVFFPQALFQEGIELHEIEGVLIKVYSLSRTVADCLRRSDLIQKETALRALRRGWVNQLVTLDELFYFAEMNNINQVMYPIIESLVWLRQKSSD